MKMRSLSLCVVTMLSLFFSLSCKKDDQILDPLRINSEVSACGVKDPVNNLKWLKGIVQEARKNEADKLMTIRMFEYDGATYFNSQLGYSSCMGCNIYDCEGDRVDSGKFTTEQRGALLQALNAEESVIIWGKE